MMCKVNVNNMPKETEAYVVAKLVDGKLWFWGSWDDRKMAEKVAEEFDNGIVVNNID